MTKINNYSHDGMTLFGISRPQSATMMKRANIPMANSISVVQRMPHDRSYERCQSALDRISVTHRQNDILRGIAANLARRNRARMREIERRCSKSELKAPQKDDESAKLTSKEDYLRNFLRRSMKDMGVPQQSVEQLIQRWVWQTKPQEYPEERPKQQPKPMSRVRPWRVTRLSDASNAKKQEKPKHLKRSVIQSPVQIKVEGLPATYHQVGKVENQKKTYVIQALEPWET